jgi:hypothetical protein
VHEYHQIFNLDNSFPNIESSRDIKEFIEGFALALEQELGISIVKRSGGGGGGGGGGTYR